MILLSFKLFILYYACIHSVLVINIFIFEQKKTFCISRQAKYTLFSVRPMHFTCVQYFLEIVGLFIYLKSILSISVLGKLFKNVFFHPKSINMVTIFFILNLSPSDRKTVVFSSLHLCIAKLIALLTVTNI